MANLLQRSLRGKRSISSIDDYAAALNSFYYNGLAYGLQGSGVQQTLAGDKAESITNDLTAYAQSAYAANGAVFALMAVRQLVFSAVRFQYQRMSAGRPGDLFGNRDLAPLEEPWLGGTTQDMLARMIQDADLAGNSYWTIADGEMVRLRPDWTMIVLEERRVGGQLLGYRKVGFAYQEGGFGANERSPVLLPARDVAHFAPYPDPLATYRGMSWLTPVIRDVQNDGLMNRHKRKFFENGATPNMVVSLDASVEFEKFKRFKESMQAEHQGVENAYKTLFLGGGADATVVGSNFEQMSFKVVQGHGETRIAAAAGVPPVIAGFSEGLQAATYSNYTQARRRFADATMHPLWQNAAGSMQMLLRRPANARLWYDARDVPFLREDEADAASIQGTKAQTIRTLIDSGYGPQSVVQAVESEDFSMLEHTGLFSVQLRPPNPDADGDTPSDSDAPADVDDVPNSEA